MNQVIEFVSLIHYNKQLCKNNNFYEAKALKQKTTVLQTKHNNVLQIKLRQNVMMLIYDIKESELFTHHTTSLPLGKI